MALAAVSRLWQIARKIEELFTLHAKVEGSLLVIDQRLRALERPHAQAGERSGPDHHRGAQRRDRGIDDNSRRSDLRCGDAHYTTGGARRSARTAAKPAAMMCCRWSISGNRHVREASE